jgi:hypothetical protein
MRDTTARALAIILTLALIGWGGYTMVAYLGIAAHRADLVAVDEPSPSGCAPVTPTCVGRATVLPALRHAVGRWAFSSATGSATPFLWFMVLSGGAIVALGVRSRRAGTTRFDPRSPLGMGVAFLAVTWLLFTTMSLGDNGSTP